MSKRPDIAPALEAGEELLWQGHPKRGRPTPLKANVLGAAFYAATILLALLAWWLEIYRGHQPQWQLVVYAVVAAAAFCTYLGLRVTLLDRRRARARDARTVYAITDRRALALAGPYLSEVSLGPDVRVQATKDTVAVVGPSASLRFERLDDAAQARDILNARIGGPT